MVGRTARALGLRRPTSDGVLQVFVRRLGDALSNQVTRMRFDALGGRSGRPTVSWSTFFRSPARASAVVGERGRRNTSTGAPGRAAAPQLIRQAAGWLWPARASGGQSRRAPRR